MVLVKRIRNRGANIVVEANGEVLFTATGEVGRWTNRFSHAVRNASEAAAPTNKRPRWGHYGKPLKSTFTASTTYQAVRMRVYSAIGSTAPHSYYVDQGTGIYAGNAPYEAKILPPWERQSPSLYEATWRPGGRGPRVRPVLIRGQKGQFFFDTGLKRGFQIMRMRSFNEPTSPSITAMLNAVPEGLLGFLGNTPADTAFRASLTEWRAWRDEAFKGRQLLGREGGEHTAEAGRRRVRAELKAKKREATVLVRQSKKHGLPAKADKALSDAVKDTTKRPRKKRVQNVAQHKADRAQFLAAMQKKYGAGNIETQSLEYRNGYWYLTVRVPMASKPGRFEFKEVRAKAKS